MQSPIADAVPHRARLAWLAAAFIASGVMFAVTFARPAHHGWHRGHHHHPPLQLVGRC